jgi:hypothetical protein
MNQAPPHFWEVQSSYAPGEAGVLKKYDLAQIGAMKVSQAWAWEDGFCRQNKKDNSGGHCDGAAHAGFYVDKPNGNKAVGGVTFNQKDREGIAVQRYWIADGGVNVDEPKGNKQQLFRLNEEPLRENAQWFRKKLETRIGENTGGVVIRAHNWCKGIYWYRAAFKAEGTDDVKKLRIDVTNALMFKDTEFNGGCRTNESKYALRFSPAGSMNQSRFDRGHRPAIDLVFFSKDTAPVLCNPGVSKTRPKADLIIRP